MILFIDTTDFNSIAYALKGRTFIKKVFKANPHQSFEVFDYLEKFLKQSKIFPKDIRKIIVNKGPGSYTGTRIGITHALALGFAWNAPVKALDKEKFANELEK